MIEREVVRDESWERARLACWFWRLAKTNFQKLIALLDVNGGIAYCSHKSVSAFFPMKDLTRIQRHRQIEIRCGNFSEFHLSPKSNTDETRIFYLCESVSIRG